jgi:competence protein ComEC
MENKTYIAVLDEFPLEKNNTYKCIINILPSNRKVLTSFEKTDGIKKAQPGDKIIFHARPQIIENRGNPFEFNYKLYLQRKQIGHRVYLSSQSFKLYAVKNRLSLKHRSQILRRRLISKLEELNLNKEPLSVISAIVLGSRHDLEQETKDSFSRSGAMHVLAVSGLHVGIIYIVLGFIFNFLGKYNRGKIIKMFIILTGLWSYAFITGLSPSVLRASTMFSVIAIGSNIKRQPNIYNSLAASAFLLLGINPNLLYDVGFQLSYSAVIAIVYFQPKFYKSIYFKHKLPDKLWALTTVSLAAQIGTLPLSLYYFHQFPVYFWLSNLVAIPLVTIIIYTTLLLFVLAPIPFIGWILVNFLEKMGELLITTVKSIEILPGSVIENIYLSYIEMFLLFGLIISFTNMILRRRGISTIITLFIITLLLLFHTSKSYKCQTQRKIIVFNVQGHSLLMLINSNNAIIYTTGKEDLNKLDYYLKPLIVRHKISSCIYIRDNERFVSEGDNVCINKHFVNFHNTKIVFLTDNLIEQYEIEKIPEADIFIVSAKNKEMVNILKDKLDNSFNKMVIMDGSTSKKTTEILTNSKLAQHFTLFNTTTKGAVRLNVK